MLTGDIQTDNDAKRLARFGFPVKQITTGGTCHLDARMIEKALADWRLEDIDLLLIENVGNLVCPSSYDLGEAAKIVVLSVTEGEEKPLKYPSIFFKSELMILNKIDLLPYVPFQIATAEENARRIHARNRDCPSQLPEAGRAGRMARLAEPEARGGAHGRGFGDPDVICRFAERSGLRESCRASVSGPTSSAWPRNAA